MALTVGHIFLSAGSLDKDMIGLTAGKNSLDVPVFRVNIVGDRAAAMRAKRFDAVFYHSTVGQVCSILDIAEILSACRASLLVVCRDDHSQHEIMQLRRLGDSLGLPVAEIMSVGHLPFVMSRFYEMIFRYDQSMLMVQNSVKDVISMPEHYQSCSGRLSDNGFFENSEYCAAVLLFVDRGRNEDDPVILQNFAKLIEVGISRQFPAVSVMCMGNSIVIVLADVRSGSETEMLKRGVASLPDDVGRKYKIYIGLSERSRGIRSLSALISHAARLSLVQMYSGRTQTVSEYPGQRIALFAVSLNDRSSIDAYVRDTLGAIARFDNINHSEYLSFLRVYFRNNCSLQKTASELFIHRNSVNYALRKIESITGKCLSDVSNKAEMLLALRLDEAYGMEISRRYVSECEMPKNVKPGGKAH